MTLGRFGNRGKFKEKIIKPISNPILEKEIKELRGSGYKPMMTYAGDKYRFYEGKDGRVIRVDGKDLARKEYESKEAAEGYVPVVFDLPKKDAARLWEEQKKKKQKSFSLGYRIREARDTYGDVLNSQMDPEYRKSMKEDAEDWLKRAKETAKFDDTKRKIIYPGGRETTYKDDLGYQAAKKSQQKAAKEVLKDAERNYKIVNSNKSPKSIARSEALKALTRKYSDIDNKNKSRKQRIRNGVASIISTLGNSNSLEEDAIRTHNQMVMDHNTAIGLM